MSKQKSLCVINITPIDFLLSLQGITAHRRTLLKTCSQLQRLDVKRAFETLFECFESSLIAAALAETVVALATYSLTSVR